MTENTAGVAHTAQSVLQSFEVIELRIREYKSEDCQELTALFYQTVHAVNAKDYTKEQLDAWATEEIDLEKWNQSLMEHYSLVAIEDDKIVGFGDIDRTGYLDRLYIHKDYQRRGIATAICNALEQGICGSVVTHASITAKPFFVKRGYQVLKQQQVERNGVFLTNYVIKKWNEELGAVGLITKSGRYEGGI